MAVFFFFLVEGYTKPIHNLMRYCCVVHFNYQKGSSGREVKQPFGVCGGLGSRRVFSSKSLGVLVLLTRAQSYNDAWSSRDLLKLKAM